jgi:hypothetical protein
MFRLFVSVLKNVRVQNLRKLYELILTASEAATLDENTSFENRRMEKAPLGADESSPAGTDW